METIYQQEPALENNDLFSDFESNLVQASGWKRFFNYIIDLIIFYAVIFIAAIAMAFLNPEMIDGIDENVGGSAIVDRLFYLLLYGMYMFVVEAVFKGRSLGKLITGTRAVNEDGSTITTKTALLRGLSRAVPFNAFSALGSPSYPWHDKWTRTYVIDEKESSQF